MVEMPRATLSQNCSSLSTHIQLLTLESGDLRHCISDSTFESGDLRYCISKTHISTPSR